MAMGATAWTNVKPLPRTLYGVATVSMGNKIFVTGKYGGVGVLVLIVCFIGGMDDRYSKRSEILVFDGEDWEEVGQISVGRSYHAATKIDITDIRTYFSC
jgi:N-acetylneuraminic acid mutarotase